jgi:hypothetical protein
MCYRYKMLVQIFFGAYMDSRAEFEIFTLDSRHYMCGIYLPLMPGTTLNSVVSILGRELILYE